MEEQVTELLANTLGIDRQMVVPNLSRESEPAWDSLNHLRLITAVEETFGIKLSMAEIVDINTVEDLEKCVRSHKEKL